METEFIKAVCELLQVELNLDSPVVVYNQNYPMPKSRGLNAAVSPIRTKPFGAATRYASVTTDQGGLIEHQTVNVQETYRILLYSQDRSAWLRAHELVWAFTGTKAQQLMEQLAFKIGYLPSSLVDISMQDGTEILTRQQGIFNILGAYARDRRVEYFDNFSEPPFTLITNP